MSQMDLNRCAQSQTKALSDQGQAQHEHLLKVWNRMENFERDQTVRELAIGLKTTAEPLDPAVVQTKLEETIERIMEAEWDDLKRDLMHMMQEILRAK